MTPEMTVADGMLSLLADGLLISTVVSLGIVAAASVLLLAADIVQLVQRRRASDD